MLTTRPRILLTPALLVLFVLGCSRDAIEPAGGADTPAAGESAHGESCAKTADCAGDLKCVQLTCVSEVDPIVLDNSNSSLVQVTGDWEESDNGTGAFNGSFLYHRAQRSPVLTVRYLPGLEARRAYEVRVWWSAMEDRTTAQQVIVRDADGAEHLHIVNLREPPPQDWLPLGAYELGPGSQIEFNTDADTDPGGNDFCNADAVQLIPL